MTKINRRMAGYSLVELLVATLLFTIISGTVFSLLSSSQLTYQGESTIAEAFQQANVAIDQIVRDVHSAGYPPASSFSTAVAQAAPDKFALPFAWSPNYPTGTCTVDVSCTIPGEYDLILEADTGAGVQWIRYSLQGTTLMRATVAKRAFKDPLTETGGELLPYLDNVMNQSQGAQIFSYQFDPGESHRYPVNVRTVNINLIVQSAHKDLQTGQFRTVRVTGQAVRFNPNQ
jgi:type II secretory pathway pseudopilin PulG